MHTHGPVPPATVPHGSPTTDDQNLRAIQRTYDSIEDAIRSVQAQADAGSEAEAELEAAVRVLRISTAPRILVVDDDRDMAQSIKYLLKSRGARVDVALNAAEGRAMLTTHAYTAVVSDYDLGGGQTSESLLAYARDVQPGARRILVTGADSDVGERLVALGLVAAALPKPFSTDELLAAVCAEVAHG